MDFFDKLGDNIKVKSQEVVDKAKDAKEIAKLQHEEKSKEAELSKVFEELGRTYYAAKKNRPKKGEFDEVEELQTTIKELKRQIMAIKGGQPCASCGAFIPATAAFCSACGAEAPEMPEEEVEVVDAEVVDDGGEFVEE